MPASLTTTYVGGGTAHLGNNQNTSAGSVNVGTSFGAGVVEVVTGGGMTGTNFYVGAHPGESGQVNVVGADSFLNATSSSVIGYTSNGGFAVSGGGTAGFTVLTLGSSAGTTGTLSIMGQDSTVTASNIMTIGQTGSGTVTVSGGASLDTKQVLVANTASSTASVTVTGQGSTWTGTSISLGVAGEVELSVLDGAKVDGSAMRIGGTVTGNTGAKGTVTVYGGGSAIEMTGAGGQIVVGDYGQGTLVVSGGGAASSSFSVTIGTGSAGNPTGSGSVTVTGAGSSLTSAGTISVGHRGTGVLTLSGGASASAGTYVKVGELAGSTGTINIGAAAGQAAAAPGTLTAPSGLWLGTSDDTSDGTLNFNHTGTGYVFAPELQYTGTVNHIAGTTILTANSQGFAGTTNVTGGRLVVANRLGGAVKVLGGEIGGTGILTGSLGIAEGGAVAPGNSIGTLTVKDVLFAPGSFYDVEVNALGESDRITVTGTAVLGGGVVRVSALPDHALDVPYAILTTTSNVLTDQFADATTSLAFIEPVLSYDANNVFLTLIQGADFLSVATTPNQLAVAGAVQQMATSDPIPAGLMGLTEEEARAAFEAFSGDGYASLRAFPLDGARVPRNAALERLSAEGEGLWALVAASHAALDADGNAAPIAAGSAHVFGGADGLVGDWRVGLMLHAGLGDVAAGETTTIGAVGIGVYAGTERDGTALDLGAGVARHFLASTRSVGFGGFSDRLTADYGAATAQVFGRFSHEFALPQMRLVPYGEAAYVVQVTEGFAEAGGPAALTVAPQTDHVLFTTLGIEVRHETVLANGSTLELRGGIGWRHAVIEAPTSVASLAGAAPFTVRGAAPGADALVFEAGLSQRLEGGVSLDLGYEGVLGAGSRTHAVTARLAGPF